MKEYSKNAVSCIEGITGRHGQKNNLHNITSDIYFNSRRELSG